MATFRGCWTNDKRTLSYQENSGLLLLKRGSWLNQPVTGQTSAAREQVPFRFPASTSHLHSFNKVSKVYTEWLWKSIKIMSLLLYLYTLLQRNQGSPSFLTMTHHPHLDVISASSSDSILPSSRYNTVLISLKTSRNSHPELKITDLFHAAEANLLSSGCVCICVCVYI